MAKKENLLYEWRSVIRDLSSVLHCVNNIRVLQIQGGEPFLHPDLDKVLDFCAGQSKIWQTDIATNGTIMPTNAMMEKIKTMGIRLRISNYSVSHEKGAALHEKCAKLGIVSSIYHFAYGKNEWADLGGIDTPREENDEVVRERFFSCAFRKCLTLENGELNRCSRIHVAHSLQGFKPRADDHVDVRESQELKRRIQWYLRHVDFPEACRYCLGNTPSNVRRCIPGEQIDTPEHYCAGHK